MKRIALGAAAGAALLAVAASVTGYAATLQVRSGSIDTFSQAAAATTTTSTTSTSTTTTSTTAPPTGDTRAPALVSLEMFDTNSNGKVDQVKATFDENLVSHTGSAGWTVANAPSGGSLAGVTASGTSATISIGEGPGAPDTAVGAFRVALATTSAVRDAAGNKASFAATAPLDGAAPRLLDVRDSDSSGGSGDGRFETLDWVEFVASEPINMNSLPTTTSVTILDPTGNGDDDDELTIGGVLDGTVRLGAGYVTRNNVTNVFAGSSISLTDGGRTVRVTLGSCSGCLELGRGTGTAVFRLSATVLATDGRPVANSLTKTIPLF